MCVWVEEMVSMGTVAAMWAGPAKSKIFCPHGRLPGFAAVFPKESEQSGLGEKKTGNQNIP